MKLVSVLGFLGLALSSKASLFTFDSGAITINEIGPASPSPISFSVAGLDGPISNVGIYVLGMTYEFPNELGAVLFSSTGGSTLLFDGPGGGQSTPGSWDWKFDESVTSTRLAATGINPTGFYAAGLDAFGDIFTDAPARPYGTSLLNYNGMSAASATGRWNLFIENFVVQRGGGSIQNVQLRINTVPEPATLAVLGLGAAILVRRRRQT
jgi:hypothetical protein